MKKLKDTRFLFVQNGKAMLPYRNEDGKINVRLLEESKQQIKHTKAPPEVSRLCAVCVAGRLSV